MDEVLDMIEDSFSIASGCDRKPGFFLDLSHPESWIFTSTRVGDFTMYSNSVDRDIPRSQTAVPESPCEKEILTERLLA